MKRVLVTGGCGFIGSHLVDRLVERGCDVRVLDSLEDQVHQGKPPAYLRDDVDYRYATLADRSEVKRSLDGIDTVCHLAAAVGVGQSMYEIDRYTAANTGQTATLLDVIVNDRPGEVEKIVVASSMSLYGEGSYRCCGLRFSPPPRTEEQLRTGEWDPRCPECGAAAEPVATREDSPPNPRSVYALNKYDQEQLCLLVGAAYGISAVALRLFNTYGPRQSLANPYTGVAAIFSSRIQSGAPPVVYEDGEQLRDFVEVSDVVSAFCCALDEERANGRVLNVGSGDRVTVLELAETLRSLHNAPDSLRSEVTHQYRVGDVRHCYGSIDALKSLGFAPAVGLRQGLERLVSWASSEEAEDRFGDARRELQERGLAG